jgi:hypothetical protein
MPVCGVTSDDETPKCKKVVCDPSLLAQQVDTVIYLLFPTRSNPLELLVSLFTSHYICGLGTFLKILGMICFSCSPSILWTMMLCQHVTEISALCITFFLSIFVSFNLAIVVRFVTNQCVAAFVMIPLYMPYSFSFLLLSHKFRKKSVTFSGSRYT